MAHLPQADWNFKDSPGEAIPTPFPEEVHEKVEWDLCLLLQCYWQRQQKYIIHKPLLTDFAVKDLPWAEEDGAERSEEVALNPTAGTYLLGILPRLESCSAVRCLPQWKDNYTKSTRQTKEKSHPMHNGSEDLPHSGVRFGAHLTYCYNTVSEVNGAMKLQVLINNFHQGTVLSDWLPSQEHILYLNVRRTSQLPAPFPQLNTGACTWSQPWAT